MRNYLRDLSIQAIGGALAVGLVAVSVALWTFGWLPAVWDAARWNVPVPLWCLVLLYAACISALAKIVRTRRRPRLPNDAEALQRLLDSGGIVMDRGNAAGESSQSSEQPLFTEMQRRILELLAKQHPKPIVADNLASMLVTNKPRVQRELQQLYALDMVDHTAGKFGPKLVLTNLGCNFAILNRWMKGD